MSGLKNDMYSLYIGGSEESMVYVIFIKILLLKVLI